MLKHLQNSSKTLISPDAWRARLVFWSGAVIVGLLATLFAISTEHANAFFAEHASHNPYLPFIVAPLGFMLVIWLTRRFVPEAKGSGIPQAIAAMEMSEHVNRSRLLSFKIALSKIGLCLIGMLSGASIGREGPTVHIGASVMFALGRFGNFSHHYMDKGLIMAGGAAGIAAAFNTPLAGIIFAIEEMGRTFEQRTSGVLLTAVFIAGITAIAIQGQYTYFGSSAASLATSQMLIPILACGFIGGLSGGLFSQLLIWSNEKISRVAGRWPLILAFGCGLSLAIIGYFSGGTSYGTGYQEAQAIITGEGQPTEGYALFKMAATWVSYLSGIPGGIFAPSLAAGAGVGQEIAHWLASYPAGAIIILGMVGYFSGVVQTPITAFVIVMEMTDNNELLLPLMATSFIAYATSQRVCPEPIYRALARNFMPTPPSNKAETAKKDA